MSRPDIPGFTRLGISGVLSVALALVAMLVTAGCGTLTAVVGSPMESSLESFPIGASGHRLTWSDRHGGTAEWEYVSYLPRQYPEGILLMLHGQGEDGPSFCESAHATAAADARGFLVVCPSALGGHWVQPLDVEVGFVNAVLDEVGASVSTTTSRVYVAGFSGGGWVAFHLACSMSDRIDGIAAIAASWPPTDPVNRAPAAWTKSCSPTRPLPVLNAIGRRDVIFTDPAANVEGWQAFSVDVMGYSGQPRPISVPRGLLCWQYPPLTGAPAPGVSRYCTYDLAHVWPGSANAEDDTGAWNATLAVWDFFADSTQ